MSALRRSFFHSSSWRWFRFLDLSPEATALIERFVRNREPLLYEEE